MHKINTIPHRASKAPNLQTIPENCQITFWPENIFYSRSNYDLAMRLPQTNNYLFNINKQVKKG